MIGKFNNNSKEIARDDKEKKCTNYWTLWITSIASNVVLKVRACHYGKIGI